MPICFCIWCLHASVPASAVMPYNPQQWIWDHWPCRNRVGSVGKVLKMSWSGQVWELTGGCSSMTAFGSPGENESLQMRFKWLLFCTVTAVKWFGFPVKLWTCSKKIDREGNGTFMEQEELLVVMTWASLLFRFFFFILFFLSALDC